MRIGLKFYVFGAVAFMGAGLLLSGCKSAPELSQADATKMIQAEYDSRPAAGAGIYINEFGLKQGLTAKYWQLVKVYPNMRWADYKLTDEGKKVLTLQGGGDQIEWRPEQGNISRRTTSRPRMLRLRRTKLCLVFRLQRARCSTRPSIWTVFPSRWWTLLIMRETS